jgi:transposase
MASNTSSGRDADRERRWREHIAGWTRSGLSVRAYCRRHGLSEPSFYFWRRELPARDGPAGPAAFVPVAVVPEPAAAGFEIVVPGGYEVRVGPGFDPAALRRLLAALGGVAEDRPC